MSVARERVLDSITHYLEKKLKLKVSREKSGVGRPSQRKFLGYWVIMGKDTYLVVSPEALKRLRGDLRAMLRRGRGRSVGRVVSKLNPKLRGWINYFRHMRGLGLLMKLDGWVRRHLRQILWV